MKKEVEALRHGIGENDDVGSMTFLKAVHTAPFAVLLLLASANTIIGSLPPSSNVVGIKSLAACS
ncbi:hypothetical protein PB1_02285 [Bacillus methanolicus PB1]|uniref:Uncharacterized protein n=1 Tax=Bacillus methanolicus PB1 TaxID=997296 RepID=I3E5F9_BACMT|nr:hypothetical protein PB1_02285 [Bacillus methanolicus PB1]